MKSQQFCPSDRPLWLVTREGRPPLLGDRGAFMMGKVKQDKEKTDSELPRIRGAWLLAQVVILLPKGLYLIRAPDKFPDSNYFLKVVLG